MAHLTNEPYLNKENILKYLSAFAEIMRRNYGNIVFDMLIVGGSALALKDSYRNSTVDIDSAINYEGNVSSAIKEVACKYGIFEDWLNQDFMFTESYSRRLLDNAIYLLTLKSTINVYVVSDLDQLCMKATAYRKKDMQDIRYLVSMVKYSGIDFEGFLKRFDYLYGDSVKLSFSAKKGIDRLFRSNRV